MYKIEITKPNGEKRIIETDNAVILFGNSGDEDICSLPKNDESLHADIGNLVAGATVIFIKKSINNDEKRKKIAITGMFKMMWDLDFKKILQEETEVILAEKTLNNPFDFNINPRFRGF